MQAEVAKLRQKAKDAIERASMAEKNAKRSIPSREDNTPAKDTNNEKMVTEFEQKASPEKVGFTRRPTFRSPPAAVPTGKDYSPNQEPTATKDVNGGHGGHGGRGQGQDHR